MRKKKFDETNDVSFSVETTEFGTREKRKKEKKVLSPEEKKKRTIKALIITASVVLVLAIFFGGCAISTAVGTKSLIKQGQSFDKVEYTAQLVPTFDENLGYYVFTKKDDRDFKVLQFTDVHIGGGAFSHKKDAWAMNAVATMIQKEKPDFVVVTGDIAYPVPFQSGTFNNKNATMIFAEMMETLGVYWTFAFGNHDTEYYSRYSRVDICNYYKERNFKYCLFDAGVCDDKDYIGDDAMGFGNNMFVVKNSDGSINQALVTFDSHSYIDGDYFGAAWKYDNIHQCQVDWYTREMAKLRKANGDKAVNNLVFSTFRCANTATPGRTLSTNSATVKHRTSAINLYPTAARPSLSTVRWAKTTKPKTVSAHTASSAECVRTNCLRQGLKTICRASSAVTTTTTTSP